MRCAAFSELQDTVCTCGCESCSHFFDDLIETFSDNRVRWTTLFVSYCNRKKKKNHLNKPAKGLSSVTFNFLFYFTTIKSQLLCQCQLLSSFP